MRTKVILDRAYSFSLIAYLSEAARQRRGIDLDLLSLPLLNETFSAINEASILYDKILIEKSYSTSLEKMLEGPAYKWFWDIFEPVDLSYQELTGNESLLLTDDLRFDLEDKEFLKLATAYYETQKGYRSDPRTAIRYVNLIMKSAKALDADIMPWPSRFQLFNYKFSKGSPLYVTSPSAKILETILEVNVPSFKISNLSQVMSIRNKSEIKAFRSLVWNIRDVLSDASSPGVNREEILKEFIREQQKLIEKLTPDRLDRIKMIASWFIPFPFDAALDSVYEVRKIMALRKFKWFFLLRDFSTEEDE